MLVLLLLLLLLLMLLFRAHVDSAHELVKLYADKFDLLLSGGVQKKPAGSGANQATIKCLEELKSVINGHLKVCWWWWGASCMCAHHARLQFITRRGVGWTCSVCFLFHVTCAHALAHNAMPLCLCTVFCPGSARPCMWRTMYMLQEASALEQNVKGKAMSAEAKRAQAVASIRREEAVLTQQASELAGQVRGCCCCCCFE